jgi:hypothetical protein
MVLTRLQYTEFENNFLNTITQMLRDYEHAEFGSQEERVRCAVRMNEYNIEHLPNLQYNTWKQFINCVYNKCLEFERNIENRELGQLPPDLLYNFIESTNRLKALLTQILRL